MHLSRRLVVFLVFFLVGPALGWFTLLLIDAVMSFIAPKSFGGAIFLMRAELIPSFLQIYLLSYVFCGFQAIATGLTAIGSLVNNEFKSIRIWPVVCVPTFIAIVILAAISKSESVPFPFVAITMAVHICPAVACWLLSEALLPVLARRTARIRQGDPLWRLRDIGWREWDPFWHLATGEDWHRLPNIRIYDEHLLANAAALRRGEPPDEVAEELSRIERDGSRWGLRPDHEERARATVAAIERLLIEFKGQSLAVNRMQPAGR